MVLGTNSENNSLLLDEPLPRAIYLPKTRPDNDKNELNGKSYQVVRRERLTQRTQHTKPSALDTTREASTPSEAASNPSPIQIGFELTSNIFDNDESCVVETAAESGLEWSDTDLTTC